MAQGVVVVGKRDEDKDSQVAGQLVDERTKRGIAGGLVIVLKPGVSTKDFLRTQKKEMTFTSARTDEQGKFAFPKQLPKGNAYGLVLVARGYQDLAVDGALRVTARAPEHAQIPPIAMRPE